MNVNMPGFGAYYQSEWTWVNAGELKTFPHKLHTLPSFLHIYIAPFLNNEKVMAGWIPASATPYQDYANHPIKIHTVSSIGIVVKNDLDTALYIRVGALLISGTTSPVISSKS